MKAATASATVLIAIMLRRPEAGPPEDSSEVGYDTATHSLNSGVRLSLQYSRMLRPTTGIGDSVPSSSCFVHRDISSSHVSSLSLLACPPVIA